MVWPLAMGVSDAQRYQPRPCVRLRGKTRLDFPQDEECMQMVREKLGQLEPLSLEDEEGQDAHSDFGNDFSDEDPWANAGFDEPF